MYGTVEELCQAQYVPPLPHTLGASKPCGQVPDWVATTIWASVRSVMFWLAAKVSASAAIAAWLACRGGVLLSLNAPANTDLLKIGAPELSPYCDRMVDQLSLGWPCCRAPRPA